MIEVATFRQDAEYSDGRHPDRVTFSSAREDAARRDFTINGMFFDPIDRKVIDFVGGQEDLRKGLIRAIGAPRMRFGEDKLRMLRAVRFAAALGFAVDAETAAAVREMAGQITVVSPERIAMEMRRVLTESGRVPGVRLLVELGLAAAVLPEIVPGDEASQARAEHALGVLGRLQGPSFPLALAALLAEQAEAATMRRSGSPLETLEPRDGRSGLAGRASRCPVRGPRLALVEVATRAGASLGGVLGGLARGPVAAWAGRGGLLPPAVGSTRETLDPPPLVTGDDLRGHGLQPGPKFKKILQAVRDAQLDGEIRTQEEAIKLAVGIN